jgi:pyrroline-5-carboxylate reductase
MFKKIAILGGGNLGTSIAMGLLKSRALKKEQLIISEIRTRRQAYLKKEGFKVVNNIEALKLAEFIIIAVKPQQYQVLLDEIKSVVDSKIHIINYTVSGIRIEEFEKVLGKVPIFRIMPNTAVEICESMTCIAHKNAAKSLVDEVEKLYNKLGKSLIIDESLMEGSTVLGACGIAYALRFIRAATQGGIEIGFHPELSQLITAQTVKGAAELILSGGNHPEREIDKVTTPQGITISGLNEMEHQGFSSALIKGIITSYRKLIKTFS